MIKYELSHDTIARQVYEKSSAETKARRKVQLLIERACQRYQERGILLTQEDLDELKPHEHNISFATEEQAFIQKSKIELQRQARRRRQLTIGIILVLTGMLIFALWQWRLAKASNIAQKRVTLAIQARQAIDKGDPSLAYRLAEAANHPDNKPETQAAIQEVLTDLNKAGLTTDFVHEDAIESIAISADEQRFLTGDHSGIAHLWNAQGDQLATYQHSGAITHVDFSPWDQNAVTASLDSTLCFRDAQGKCRLKLTHPEAITKFELKKDRNLVLISGPNQASLYHRTGVLLKRFVPEYPIVAAELSPNGSHLLIATKAETQIWNTFFLSEQFIGQDIEPQFCTVQDSIQAAHFIQSDARNIRWVILTEKQAAVYDKDCSHQTPNYRALEVHLNRNRPIEWLTFSHPGYQNPKVLWVSNTTEVRMWSAYRIGGDGNAKTDLNLFSDTDEPFYTASFSPTDRYLLICGATNWVNIWNLGLGQDITRAFRFKSKVTNAIFSAKDHWLLTTAGDHTAHLWNLSNKSTTNDWTKSFDRYSKRLRQLTDQEREFYLE